MNNDEEHAASSFTHLSIRDKVIRWRAKKMDQFIIEQLEKRGIKISEVDRSTVKEGGFSLEIQSNAEKMQDHFFFCVNGNREAEMILKTRIDRDVMNEIEGELL